jgi:hypothetical protein
VKDCRCRAIAIRFGSVWRWVHQHSLLCQMQRTQPRVNSVKVASPRRTLPRDAKR